jgi:hypothetical protein
MTKNIKNYYLIILFLLPNLLLSQKYSNEFLSIGVGAKNFSMGGAVVASVNDVTSGYWNPAGLNKISANAELGLMHAEYFAGIAKYDYGAFAKKLKDSSVLAFSFIRFAIDDIQNTLFLYGESGLDAPNYDNITSFSVSDNAFLISYARNIGVPNLTIGANFKIIRRNVGDFANAWGFGIDAAANYKLKKWDFAFVARDLTGTFNAWSYSLSESEEDILLITGNELPENSIEITTPKFILGVSRLFDLNNKMTLQPEIDFELTTDGQRNVLVSSSWFNLSSQIGIDYSFKLNENNSLFLRFGVNNFQKERNFDGDQFFTVQPNLGLGIKLKFIYVDYALTNIGAVSVSPYSNVFSLKFDINKFNIQQ